MLYFVTKRLQVKSECMCTQSMEAFWSGNDDLILMLSDKTNSLFVKGKLYQITEKNFICSNYNSQFLGK